MDKPKQGIDQMVDRVIDYPADDMFGGDDLFLDRRLIHLSFFLSLIIGYRCLLRYLSGSLPLGNYAIQKGLEGAQDL